MQVVSISVSTLLFPMIIIITLAVFFIYKAFYDKHTNKVLEGSETKKKKWIAPWGLALIVLGAQLILVAGFMFPLSMLMVDHSVVELSEDSPMHFDVSDSVKFVIDESNYGSGTTFNDDGITVPSRYPHPEPHSDRGLTLPLRMDGPSLGRTVGIHVLAGRTRLQPGRAGHLFHPVEDILIRRLPRLALPMGVRPRLCPTYRGI